MVEKKKVTVQKVSKPVTRKKPSSKLPTSKTPIVNLLLTNKSSPVTKKLTNKKATLKSKTKKGRPTTYSDKIAVKVLVRVASGWSMRKIASKEGMPAMSTIFLWLRNYEDFSEQYTRAKEEAADLLVEEILEIADDATNDYMIKLAKDGSGGEGMVGYMINGEFVNRSKLRIETRKWLAMKLKPKRYGDKLAVEQEGEVRHTHAFEGKSDEELEAIIRAHLGKKK